MTPRMDYCETPDTRVATQEVYKSMRNNGTFNANRVRLPSSQVTLLPVSQTRITLLTVVGSHVKIATVAADLTQATMLLPRF